MPIMQNLGRRIEDPIRSLFLVRSLNYLPDINPSGGLRQRFIDEIGPLDVSTYAPISTTSPSWYCAKNASYGVLLVGGAGLPSLATSLWDGYVGSFYSDLPRDGNAFIESQAQMFRAYLQSLPGPHPETWILAGHSAGGAIVQRLASFTATLPYFNQRNVCTFGAPRMGSHTVASLLNVVPIIRWMNNDDWVPLIPPHVTLGDSLGWIVGGRARSHFTLWCHSRGGVQLSNGGIVSQEIAPTGATFPTGWAIVQRLVESQGRDLPFVSHSLPAYQDRLEQLIALHANMLYGGGGDEEEPNPIPPAEIRRTQEATTATVFHTGTTQNAVPVYIPRDQAFSSSRVGRVWSVWLGGAQICIAPNRRRAQGMARAGNDFIRRLQRQAIVDPEGLGRQFLAYISSASDVGGNFKPVMNVNVPV